MTGSYLYAPPPHKEDWYESIVPKHGFPGGTKSSHALMYRRLKERALRHFVTHEMKSSVHSREHILLLSGVRAEESKIRMGYKHITQKDASKVWCNPIFYWTEKDCARYMEENNIAHNPVKDKIGISGECLCGAWATKEEYDKIKEFYPATAAVIDKLSDQAKENGKMWEWWSGPNEHKKEQNKQKADNIQCKINFMCAGCPG